MTVRFSIEKYDYYCYYVLISAIIIGFEETNYAVNESVGMLQVYVSVISPPPDVELFATVVIGIQSVARTASKYNIVTYKLTCII